MISTSSGFQTLLGQSSRHFMAQILHSGSVLDCNIKSIKIYKGSCGENELTIGSVYSSYAELTIEGLTTLLENEDIEIKLGMTVSGQPEYITIGKFTVSKIKSNTYESDITAVGFISSKLAGMLPALQSQTIPNIIAGITAATGLTVTLSGLTSAGTITEPLPSMTCMEALGLVAFLLGGYATETADGNIRICKYQIPSSKLAVDGDRMISDPTFGEIPFEMTGVKVTVSPESIDGEGEEIPEVSYESGTVRQTYENKYMTAEMFTAFAANVVGYTYMPGEVGLSLGDPRLEPWDCLAVTDKSGNTYNVPCFQLVHNFDGGLSTEISAVGTSSTDSVPQGVVSKSVDQLKADMVTARKVVADSIEATNARFVNVEADTAKIHNLTADQLSATTAYIGDLTSEHITASDLAADHSTIGDLHNHYAEIDFANINTAEIDVLKTSQLLATIGMVTNLAVQDGHITGKLSSVEIDGDVLNINHINANSLYLRGDDGLYYGLNVNALGEAYIRTLTPAQQEALKNGIHGENIVAGSITASKVYVSDLSAFNATIAGLVLSNGSIHTATKSSVSSSAPGIYMDSVGQFNTGDNNNYIASWYDTSEQKWRVAISAETISLGNLGSVTDVIHSVQTNVNNTLMYDHEYTLNSAGTMATFTAHVYRSGQDVTSQFSDDDFTWYYKTDATNDRLPINRSSNNDNKGKTMTVLLSDMKYGGEVIGVFTSSTVSQQLLRNNGDGLTDSGNRALLSRSVESGNSIRVRDLTYTTTLYPTDAVMVVTSETEKLASIDTLSNTIKSSTTPLMDGTASIGSEKKYASGDHRHPTDTTRAPLASPSFTGVPTAPTPPNSNDTIQLATTAFVHNVLDDLSIPTKVTDLIVDIDYISHLSQLGCAYLEATDDFADSSLNRGKRFTAEKPATQTHPFILENGSLVAVKFPTNVVQKTLPDGYDAPEIRIWAGFMPPNAYTNYIPIYYKGEIMPNNQILANDVALLVYDAPHNRFEHVGYTEIDTVSSTKKGLVPAYGTPYSDEHRVFVNGGWYNISTYGYTLQQIVDKAITSSSGGISDVQINGSSVVSNGIATIPKATGNDFGVVKAVVTGNDPPTLHLDITNNVGTYSVPLMSNGVIKPYLLPLASSASGYSSTPGAITGADKTKIDNLTNITTSEIDTIMAS